MSIVVEGVGALVRTLRRSARIARVAGEEELLRLGRELAAEAAARVPVRTGRLRSSMRVERDGGAVIVGPAREAFYGLFVEFGTKKMAPRPFLTPAYEHVRARAERELGVRIAGEIRRRLRPERARRRR